MGPQSRKRLYMIGAYLIALSTLLIVFAAFFPSVEKQLAAYPVSFWCKVGPPQSCAVQMNATFPMYSLILGVLLSVFPPVYEIGKGFAKARGWVK